MLTTIHKKIQLSMQAAGYFRKRRILGSSRLISTLAVITLLAAFILPGVALAEQPPGCTENNFFMSLAKDKLYIHQGEVIKYTVHVANSNPIDNGCDIDQGNVTFTQPAADGNPTGAMAVLDTNHFFPEDGSGDTTYLPASYPILNYTVAVNPSVTLITARAFAEGLLLDDSPGSPTDITKDVAATVLWPSISVDKVSDYDTSKVGDTIVYTITVTNTNTVNIAAIANLSRVSVTDSLLGNITAAFNANLPKGASESHTFSYTVQSGDPDPLINTVSAVYEDITGYDVTDTDNAMVDLVQPGINVTKTAVPTQAQVGQSVIYTITVTNTGDVALNLDSVTDSIMGDLRAANPYGTPFTIDPLAAGASESHTYTRTIQSGDHDPLVNVVTVHYNPVGPLTNDITDSDDATVDIVYPTPTPSPTPTRTPTPQATPTPPPAVGGTSLPTDKMGVATPWIIAAAVLTIAAISLVVWNRRHRKETTTLN